MHRLDPLGHPRADRVVAAGEVVRVVRVQALDADARPADAAPRGRARLALAALVRVLAVRPFDPLDEGRIAFETTDPSVGLEVDTDRTAAGHVSQ